jgi:phosphorylase/glycogen(starch) synthase
MADQDPSCSTPVAYFSAEYGLQSDLPLYAGGLGVLSVDTG